ncbi:MAG: protein phosphatase 2C domain-containing protein [Oscillospiraceae bacterium]|jgi:serine/threonine protein phosphatase PrpC|nr:protein phosphatase 2C domain-containing protein [Oscillospiraceae bacterium]
MSNNLFMYPFRYATGVDIGKKRTSNQDEIICCPEYNFFAVSDGMGGMYGGAETSAMIAKTLPLFIREAYKELKMSPSPEFATQLLNDQLCLISDNIYETLNRAGSKHTHGATLCGVWLVGNHAVFINLGDSRGYLLGYYKRHISQITKDHNIAATLVANGDLTSEEARYHSSSASLTRFVGMEKPAAPEVFILKVGAGDRLLLCSDGLSGMVEDNRITNLLRSSKSPNRVIHRLIDEANHVGGRDNISVIYIKL